MLVGFGRTGAWFGVDHGGVAPDLLVFAKGVNRSRRPDIRRGGREGTRGRAEARVAAMTWWSTMRSSETAALRAQRELRVVALAAEGAVAEAAMLLTTTAATVGSADGARQFEEGQGIEVSRGASGGVPGRLGASSSAGATFELNLGYSTSGKLSRTVERVKGKILLIVAVEGDPKSSGGGSVGYGVGSAGGTWSAGSQEGRSVTFSLNPKTDPGTFDAAYKAIMDADSEAEL